MLLSISTTYRPATDLGFLLHKHPERFQTFDLSFGKAHVFYPEVAEARATAALLLDVDPVGMVRGKSRNQSFLLGHYVNDRPYVASSFMSVAISQMLSSALAGRCKDRPDLVVTPIHLYAGCPPCTQNCGVKAASSTPRGAICRYGMRRAMQATN